MLKNFAFALAAIFLLAVPAAAFPVMITVPQAEPGDYSKIHNVGVLVALGDQLRLYKHVGFLNDVNAQRNIADWKLNDQASEVIHQVLGSRFNLVDMPADQATIAEKIKPAFLLGTIGALTDTLKAYQRSDLDAFLVVRPVHGYGDNDGITPGLSLEMPADSSPWLWANYEITLIDAHNYRVIASSYSRMRVKDSASWGAFPALRGPEALMMDDKLTPNEAHSALLKTWMTTLVRVTVTETLRSLNFGGAVSAMAGRALVPFAPGQDPFANVKSIAIVSAIGDSLELRITNNLPFSDKSDRVPVPDWGLDAHLEAGLRNLLGKRFTIKEVPVDRSQLAGGGQIDESGRIYPDKLGLTPTSAVDAYVLILRFPRLAMSVRYSGIGIAERTALLARQTFIYAGFAIAVYDARTLKLIRAVVGNMSPAKPYNIPMVAEPDNSLWPKTPADFTPQQSDAVKAQLTDMLDDATIETALQVGLLGKMTMPSVSLPEPPAAPDQSQTPPGGARTPPKPGNI